MVNKHNTKSARFGVELGPNIGWRKLKRYFVDYLSDILMWTIDDKGMLFAVLNVAPIKTPKFAGRWYYALIAYTVTISVIFGWQWSLT